MQKIASPQTLFHVLNTFIQRTSQEKHPSRAVLASQLREIADAVEGKTATKHEKCDKGKHWNDDEHKCMPLPKHLQHRVDEAEKSSDEAHEASNEDLRENESKNENGSVSDKTKKKHEHARIKHMDAEGALKSEGFHEKAQEHAEAQHHHKHKKEHPHNTRKDDADWESHRNWLQATKKPA